MIPRLFTLPLRQLLLQLRRPPVRALPRQLPRQLLRQLLRQLPSHVARIPMWWRYHRA
jgi:hypothetical protein